MGTQTSRALALLVAAGAALSVGPELYGQCPPAWSGLFPGGEPNGAVRGSVTFDDGTGPALYVAGDFTLLGPVPASKVGKWNGQRWLPLTDGSQVWSSGINGLSLAVFDDDNAGPHGPALYLGISTAGSTSGVSKWTGTAWSALPLDVRNNVSAMTVYDDGTGPALYAAGNFNGVFLPTGSSRCLAKWNGSAWAALSTGLTATGNPVAYSLCVFDEDGAGPGGPALFVAGDFTGAGGVPVARIARWQNGAFSAVGGGVPFIARAMSVWDDDGAGPHGPALFVGGGTAAAGTDRLRKWDGSAWTQATTGITGSSEVVICLRPFDPDGAGPAASVLFVGGTLSDGGTDYTCARRWDGTSFVSETVYAGDAALTLGSLDADGAGPQPEALYVGGTMFGVAPLTGGANFFRWSGSQWETPDKGKGLNYTVTSMAAFDPDNGGPQAPKLAVGGSFLYAGGQPSSQIVTWDGQAWASLPPVTGNLLPLPYALCVHDDGSGSGPALFMGGGFQSAGGVVCNGVAKWGGTQWQSVGSGVSGGIFSTVYAMASWDEDGAGPNPASLFVGGDFTIAGGLTVNRVARWDGQAWAALGTGTSSQVNAMAVFDDGTGPALFVGGGFTTVNGATNRQVAKWNGSSWLPTASGPGGTVYALAGFDEDGAGPGVPVLVAAGVINPSPLFRGTLMKWNGAAWSVMATMGSSTQPEVRQLLVMDDDGPGPRPEALFIGGYNMNCGGATRIGRWSGGAFSQLLSSSGYDLGVGYSQTAPSVYALCSFDDGLGGGVPALYAGGSFASAGAGATPGFASARIARWGISGGPQIVSQPAGQTAPPGSVASFNIVATGVPPLTYQWRKNGSPVANGGAISGATAATLVINPVGVADAGSYDAIITSGCSGASTQAAVLVVPGAPTPCYPNCDSSTAAPVLNVQDFSCFLQKFAAADPYANCDASTAAPALNVQDFSCFLQKFAAGCP